MKLFKKVGALTSASALAGLAVFAGAVSVANAAPVTLVIAPNYVVPGESVTVTIDGCSVGSTLDLMENGEPSLSETVIEGGLPWTAEFGYKELEAGTVYDFSVTCTPAEGSDEAVTSASDTVTVFGASYLEAEPDTFHTGETVSITAGDFLPGTAVTLAVIPSGSEVSVYSSALGTAADDFSVTGDVVFPEDLECGTYTVEITGGDDSVSAELSICGATTPEPSPSPSVSASATPTLAPSASPQPSATASPTRPTNPGLPSTGN
ncbi:hypothetical protein [Tessaracoccus antarcticus]|uniref:Bacterial Ig-like domain-containing protein n=1 Tax=Tessaracoccus antarcticus TaxID=2479848 RepID=A0A3M0GDG4_9ACTN|nr:hypothetical protein [Tessaracoccus antarcticus]RMB59633.1 hypothetical protein EAX62_07610 [Tessaracoccus antarcticus]